MEHQVNLGESYRKLGDLSARTGGPADGLDWFAKAITKLEEVRQRIPKHLEAARVLRHAYSGRAEALTKLARHAEAAQDWGRAAPLTAGPERLGYRLRRAAALARSGDDVAAAAEAGALAEGTGLSGNTLYDLACVYAAAAAATQGPGLAGRYAARAMELLQRAQSGGYFQTPDGVKRLRDDAALAPLMSREEFPKFVRGVGAEGPGPR